MQSLEDLEFVSWFPALGDHNSVVSPEDCRLEKAALVESGHEKIAKRGESEGWLVLIIGC